MTGRCIHCLAPVTPPAEVCGACVDLLSDLADDYVEPPPQPAREPGCDDRPAFTTVIACERAAAPKPRRDARWLLWACNKRGKLREAQALGRERGFPRNLLQWSPDMVAVVVEALQRQTTPR
jgi:hypothetical protein